MNESPLTTWQLFAKRAFDMVIASAVIVLTWHLMAVTALAIKFGSPGPVFFRQERVGRRFRRFRILKFRTMVTDAERRGPQITAGADARITRVGRVLRKLKIDELPQLFNVLIGDMSLVGPRPEVPKYVEMFHDEYRYLLQVRPGITDPASIEFREENAILARSDNPEETYVRTILPQKIALSKRYLGEFSLQNDMRLIGKTLGTVLAGRAK